MSWSCFLRYTCNTILNIYIRSKWDTLPFRVSKDLRASQAAEVGQGRLLYTRMANKTQAIDTCLSQARMVLRSWCESIAESLTRFTSILQGWGTCSGHWRSFCVRHFDPPRLFRGGLQQRASATPKHAWRGSTSHRGRQQMRKVIWKNKKCCAI